MNDFQEQAKNWLRNVVKQNPDKIKAGVEKAGDLIDKQNAGEAPGQAGAEPAETSQPASQSGETAPGSTPGTSAGSSAGTAQSETSDGRTNS